MPPKRLGPERRAILFFRQSEMDLCAEFLRKLKLPHQLRKSSSSVFDPAHDSIKVMTLHVSKGPESPVVALVGSGRMPAEGEDEREEARLFYVLCRGYAGDAAVGDWG